MKTVAGVRASAARGAPGFTLTELLVVLGIIGMLMGLVVGVVSLAKKRAREVAMASTIYDLSQACEQFKIQYNQYPWAPVKNDADFILTEKVVKEMDPSNDKLYPSGKIVLDDKVTDYTLDTFRINRSKSQFLKIADKYIDKEGKFVDLYQKELMIWLDPTNGMPVIWSTGANRTNQTIVPSNFDFAGKKWLKRDFGDDINNQ